MSFSYRDEADSLQSEVRRRSSRAAEIRGVRPLHSFIHSFFIPVFIEHLQCLGLFWAPSNILASTISLTFVNLRVYDVSPKAGSAAY